MFSDPFIDDLGTPRVVVEVARNVPVWTWDLKSEAFGNSVPNQNPDGDADLLMFDMRFPGQRHDTTSGLSYNYFRDYDAGSGRYVESDPIGLLGGLSTYSYVSSMPTRSVDLFGLLGCIAQQSDSCPYEGRYSLCCRGYLKDATWLGNQARWQLCKRSVDAACKKGDQAVCCMTDFNACSGGGNPNEPDSGSNGQAKYLECKTKYIQCMAGGRGK